MINTLLIYISITVIIGILSILLFRNKRFHYISASLLSLSSFITLVYSLYHYSSINHLDILSKPFSWSFPFGEFTVGLDALSLFFMIPLLILVVACSLYGAQYFRDHHPGILHWFNYAMLISGMAMVLCARNGILFIVAWEIMSFASFLLVITDSEKESVRRAGWIYFITAHIGTAFLLVTFLMLAAPVHSFEFSAFANGHYSPLQSNLIFVFALIAFGMKAGFIPFHIWLPLAHPAAPSHVSAVMSGIMIKMGIYGILRSILFIGSYQAWWGMLFIIMGSISGILGVLFAIGQHDIKRLLAYHSVENIGIIVSGIGVGILGVVYHYPVIAALGFAGALLHVLNHSLFKALLFLGAGAVIRQTGTGRIDALGGLIKKMPWTAYLFLIAAVAISGLPFLNGFISEMFIYGGAITGTVGDSGTLFSAMNAIVVISFAAIGGLAVACFTKVFGIVFLGTGRDKTLNSIKEVPGFMTSGMIFLGIFIVFIGMCSFAIVPFLTSPVTQLTGNDTTTIMEPIILISKNLTILLGISLGIILLVMIVRFLLLKRHVVYNAETWGCGYTKPDESMQYTASSFAEPITDTFKTVLDMHKDEKFSNKILPGEKWSFKSHVNDWILNNICIAFIKHADKFLGLFRWIQCGKAGVYVLYIVATLLALIIWMFFIWK